MLKSCIVSVWMKSSIIHRLPCDTGWANNNPFTESSWLSQMSSQKLHSCCSDCARIKGRHACEPCMPDQNRRPFASVHLRITSACIKWQHLEILKSHECRATPAVRLWLRRRAGVRNIITPGPTQSLLFIKFWGGGFHRGVRAVDIEVYRLYSCGLGKCM